MRALVQLEFTDAVKPCLEKWPFEVKEVLEELVTHFFQEYFSKDKVSGKEILVSVSIVNSSEIQKVNSEYRDKDYPTDVLSFPIFDSLIEEEDWLDFPLIEMGDIFICWEKTQEQASKFNLEAWEEFLHLYIHGLLHLAGFDHEKGETDQKLMEEWEKRIMSHCSSLVRS